MASLAYGEFAGDGCGELLAEGVALVAFAEEEHEFGDDAFDGAVVAVDDTAEEELFAGFVACHLDGAFGALRDVDDDDAALLCCLELFDEPGPLRGVARAVGFEDYGAQVVDAEYGGNDFAAYAREEREHGQPAVEAVVGLEGQAVGRVVDVLALIDNVDAGVGEGVVVEGAEGVEALGVDFSGAVAPHEPVFKENAHFGHHGLPVGIACGGYFDGGEQVFLAVGAQFAHGQL